MSSTYNKIACFTDIHWGLKQNSEDHNNNCIKFIEWMCDDVSKKHVEAIVFLGDWFDNRSTINVHTLNFSHIGLSRLNKLNIPIFMIVGNHDMYHRHNRDIHSLVEFNNYTNVKVIDQPTIVILS